MRCASCNEILDDDEATLKGNSGEYLDLCEVCLADIPFDEFFDDDQFYNE